MKYLRESNQGFTLLELIISLGVIGAIVAVSLGTIRLGTSAQETGQLKIDTFQRLRLIQNQLGQKIKSNYPVFMFQDSNVFASKNFEKSPKRILSFEGKKNSLRFMTFSSPLTSQENFPWAHETFFYVGEHPESGKSGIIMAERTLDRKNSKSTVFNKNDQERFFLLAENIDYLKFRYYQIRKLSPEENKLLVDKSKKYQGQWVTSIEHNSLKKNMAELTEDEEIRVQFEEKNRMSLPRAVEVSLGLKEPHSHGAEDSQKLVFSPPIIIPLYSGMRFALPIEGDENA